MALTADIPILRVGSEGVYEPYAAPLKASNTVYRGSFALLRSGYIVNGATPMSTDVVLGVVEQVTGGTAAETGPGIAGGSVDGGVWIDCARGSFLFLSGTGADALTEATAGSTVYVVDEKTVGATNGGSSRPAAGIQLPIDPTVPTGYVPVKLNPPAS